jgi:hypothetical protein
MYAHRERKRRMTAGRAADKSNATPSFLRYVQSMSDAIPI